MTALLEEGFKHINDEFNTLSGCVRMPIQQVIQCFTQQYAHSNSANEWNAYQQYFAAHKAQELQRLPGGSDVTGMPLEKMSKCYKLFCKQFPDTYKQILAMYKDTVFNSIAKCHAFEGAFLLAGSVINQDSGIGYMHTTPSAENFFLEWCCADEDEMMRAANDVKDPLQQKMVKIHVLLSRALWIQRSGAITDACKLYWYKHLLNVAATGHLADFFPGRIYQRTWLGARLFAIISPTMSYFPARNDNHAQRPDTHDALYYSRSPVIYGAPPESDSKHAFAKRMYANLKCNCNGAACKSSASTTHLKKKKTSKPMHNIEVISIPDSDEIMPNPVPHTKAKCPAPSVHDLDEIKEISPVVRKSTWLQLRVVILWPSVSKKCTRQVAESEDNDDDSVDIGNLEYNPNDKASSNQESDTKEARVAEEGNVLEDERQSLSHKRKCTFDNTGHDLKRLANNPK
ncbi:hypothetical protein EDC04DRAFT_2605817 [Pisolithus marmoratus]|nr:hypothetical protein EDC04DRAFT_2605817 [Pisolithus marmoratus]